MEAGSSPLARGLRSHLRIVPDKDRIIPARAGFTYGDLPEQMVEQGSSPLARGLLDLMVITELQERIIPARAGFTLCV